MSDNKRMKQLWLIWDKFGILMIFIMIAAIFAILEPRVIEINQIGSVLNRSSWVAVAAIGMTFAICSGGFDLSVGSIMSLSGSILARTMMLNGFSTTAAILTTLFVAAICGLINGLLITKLRIQPFVATLSTMLVFNGVTQAYTANIGTRIEIEQYQQGLVSIGRGLSVNIEAFGQSADISLSKIIIVVVLFALAIAVYRNTRFGTKVRAIGSNELSARTSGINADGVLIIVYMMTAVTAAIAAILFVSTLQTASPRAGVGFELDVITAVVLGGTALSGGRGNLVGTFLGAFIVAFSRMCLNFLGASEAIIVIVTGGILLFALSINGIKLIIHREVT